MHYELKIERLRTIREEDTDVAEGDKEYTGEEGDGGEEEEEEEVESEVDEGRRVFLK